MPRTQSGHSGVSSWSSWSSWSNWRGWWPGLVALASAALILGPALGSGLVEAYDLGVSPDPRFTPAVWGWLAPTPRVVPSDAVLVLAGKVLTASVAQKAMLLALLVCASLGALALLRRWVEAPVHPVGVVATVLLAQWNPFVAERLVIGQWTVLLGYALIPWIWWAVLRIPERGYLAALAVLGIAVLGGANSWLMVLAAGLPLLAAMWRTPAVRSALAPLSAVAVAGAAGWALPALLAGSGSPTSAGTTAFAARSDTPLGLVVSVLTGGGIWNPTAWYAQRGSVALVLAAVLGVLLIGAALLAWARAGDRAAAALSAISLGWVAVVLLGSWSVTAPGWASVIEAIPGGGVLRDAQKLIAPWVILLAVALGRALGGSRQPANRSAGGAPVRWFAALVPVPLALSMAWGIGGRLEAVTVPDGLRQAATLLSQADPGGVSDAATAHQVGDDAGLVGVLPWSQYRRYPWNEARVSLSLAPRMVDRPVLFNDALPLSSGTVPGEDPRAAGVSAQIAEGMSPVAALRAAGVRYLLVETDAASPAQQELPDDLKILLRTPDAVVAEVPENATASTPEPQAYTARIVGWCLTVLAGLGPWLLLGWRGLRRRRRHVRSVRS